MSRPKWPRGAIWLWVIGGILLMAGYWVDWLLVIGIILMVIGAGYGLFYRAIGSE